MKIECTKHEWHFLRNALLVVYDSYDSYEWPTFTAKFIQHGEINENGNRISISGKFTDEQMDEVS